MGLKVGSVDHHGLLLTMIHRQPDHYLGEDPLVTPPLPTVVDCLVRFIVPKGIAPPQAIAIDEDLSHLEQVGHQHDACHGIW